MSAHHIFEFILVKKKLQTTTRVVPCDTVTMVSTEWGWDQYLSYRQLFLGGGASLIKVMINW